MEWLIPFVPAILGGVGQVARILWAMSREKSDEYGDAYLPSKLHFAKTLFYGAVGGAVVGAGVSFIDPVYGMFTALGAGWASADAIETGEEIIGNLLTKFRSK